MEYLDIFFEKSIQNHIDFVDLTKNKSLYIYEIKNMVQNDKTFKFLEKSFKITKMLLTTLFQINILKKIKQS